MTNGSNRYKLQQTISTSLLIANFQLVSAAPAAKALDLKTAF
jgi:hypothetical protein